jgi:hypothetical protein
MSQARNVYPAKDKTDSWKQLQKKKKIIQINKNSEGIFCLKNQKKYVRS